jgi:hypothetical protein
VAGPLFSLALTGRCDIFLMSLKEFDRMTVQELEKAIAKLSLEELAELRAWFYLYGMEECDRQIPRDSESGKLQKLIEQAKPGYATGNGWGL